MCKLTNLSQFFTVVKITITNIFLLLAHEFFQTSLHNFFNFMRNTKLFVRIIHSSFARKLSNIYKAEININDIPFTKR